MDELEGMVRPAGFEPTAPGLGILCSILLSYGRASGFIAWRVQGIKAAGKSGGAIHQLILGRIRLIVLLDFLRE